jgi:hypothetical protein
MLSAVRFLIKTNMGIKINISIGAKVMVKYQDPEDNCEGKIFGKITNIFNGFIVPNLDYDQEAVTGIFVDKWIENGKKLEIKRNINDKTNIYRQDMIYEIDEIIEKAIK